MRDFSSSAVMLSSVLILFQIVGETLSKTASVRLVDGASACSGRLEIFYNGLWKPVCGSNWDLLDAGVMCKELGCGIAEEYYKEDTMQNSPAAWTSNMHCTGLESTLMDCDKDIWGSYSCNKYAGAICYSNIRLVNGTDSCSGRVEVLHDGQWGTVCDDGWDLSDAAVVCRQLGCGDAIEAKGGAYFGEGSGEIWMSNVNCSANESILSTCNMSSTWGMFSSNHQTDAGVICQSVIRLVNSNNFCSGNVEVYHKGIWGTVCDDYWGSDDALVVCRELGCGTLQKVTSLSYFGATAGQIWMDNVGCLKTEQFLRTCKFNGWGVYSCRYTENAGVICGYPVRLVNGTDSCSGRVEVYRNGQWGTVCDNGWDLSDAAVVCRELGCGPYPEAKGGSYFRQGLGPIWMSGVDCVGSESTLIKCNSAGWSSNSCGHQQDAGVICRDTAPEQVEGKVVLRIEVKAGLGVNPNDAAVRNALLEEIQKKLETNEPISLSWKTQSDGNVFQEVSQDKNIVQPCN